MTVIPAPSCTDFMAIPRPVITENLWWRLDYTSNHTRNMLTGAVMTNGSLGCNMSDYLVAQQYCAPIQAAASGTGPFANCQAIGAAIITTAYDNCAFDYCALPTQDHLCQVHNLLIIKHIPLILDVLTICASMSDTATGHNSRSEWLAPIGVVSSIALLGEQCSLWSMWH